MRTEVKAWAKEFREGNKWNVWKAMLVVSFLSSLGNAIVKYFAGPDPKNPSLLSGFLDLALGIVMMPIAIGLITYLVNLIKGKEFNINQLFSKFSGTFRYFITDLLQGIIIFLFTLLLIVPGIIRAFAYTLVQYILADPEYDNLGAKEVLDLSKDIMDGHKMDFFLMNLYYVGMMILGCFTLGILWIWTIPEMTLANTKFATNLLDEYKASKK